VTLSLDIRPTFAVVTFGRPDPANRLDRRTLDELREAVAALGSDPSMRVIVITGEGHTFSLGWDAELVREAQHTRGQALRDALAAQPLQCLAESPLPTIAAINGDALSAGLELALACDLRVAKDDIKLGMPPAKLGLVYSHTGLRRFIDAIGAARTRELFLLGRYIDAPTALAWGLVNRVAPAEELDAVALELAGELASNAPLSQTGNKRVIASLLSAEGKLDAGLEEELIELRRASFASKDMREGMRAFAEKRRAHWRGE